jgi:subtilisin family serine protease
MARTLAALALLGLWFFASGERAHADPPQTPPGLADRVIVKYRGGASAQALDGEGTPPSLAAQGYRALAVPPGRAKKDFADELRRRPDVESVEFDVTVYAAGNPNDPYYASSQAPYLGPIGAPAAWDLATDARPVIVAVIDSGIDIGHPEFAGRLWENAGDPVSNGVDDDGNGCVDDRYGCRFVTVTNGNASGCGYTSSLPTGDVQDDHGKPGSGGSHSHGTHTAGVLGARGNNGQGTAGVAWDARIMAIKVLDCGASPGCPCGSMFDVALGIDYAVRMGAKVINLSLASQSGSDDIQALRDAVLAAKAAGAIVVAAAGNHGTGGNVAPGYPAAYAGLPQYTNVIAVAASDNTNGNAYATFSNYGPAISIAAPGVQIAGPVRVAMSPSPGQAVGTKSGTSSATPIVAGLFALIQARSPGLTLDEQVALVKGTASPAQPGPPNWAGAGIVNLGAAIGRAPFVLTGAALHDWKDVPDGTSVSVTINGVACGQTAAVNNGLVALFRLKVAAHAETPGCGAQGRPLQVFIGFGEATPVLTWPGPNQPLARIEDMSSVTPPPGSLVLQELGVGWNSIAHLAPGGQLPGAITYLTSPWTALYHWDPGAPADPFGMGRYRRFAPSAPAWVSDWTAISRFDVFWVDSNAATTAAYPNPCPCGARTIQLSQGWNTFVYTGATKRAGEALAGLTGKYTLVFSFDNLGRAWSMYSPGLPRYLNDFEALHQLRVYWIYLLEPASLTMQ